MLTLFMFIDDVIEVAMITWRNQIQTNTDYEAYGIE
jgi:hypothetical protein